MSLFFRIGIFVLLIFAIVLFNRVTFTPLVEGHGGGGGGGGGRGGGHMGISRGGGGHMGISRGSFGHGIGRGIGYAGAGYGLYYGGSNYYGGDNDYGFYDYYPPVYGEYSYDVYGNPIIVRPGYYV